jgi:hypothetical protein
MCDREPPSEPPSLAPRAAADRLAARQDVPELTAGLLGREPTRDHGKFLPTSPGPHSWEYGPGAWPDEPGWLYRPADNGPSVK